MKAIYWLIAAVVTLLIIVFLVAFETIVGTGEVTWVHNTVDRELTCQEICGLHGSKVAVDKCYGKGADNVLMPCTLTNAGYCASWQPEMKFGLDYSHACCCKGSDFAGCTSTDGSDPFVNGTTIDRTGQTVKSDVCVGQNTIVEYMCNSSGNVVNFEITKCPGACKDGACVKET